MSIINENEGKVTISAAALNNLQHDVDRLYGRDITPWPEGVTPTCPICQSTEMVSRGVITHAVPSSPKKHSFECSNNHRFGITVTRVKGGVSRHMRHEGDYRTPEEKEADQKTTPRGGSITLDSTFESSNLVNLPINVFQMSTLPPIVYIGSGPKPHSQSESGAYGTHGVPKGERTPGFQSTTFSGDVHFYAGTHGYLPFESWIHRLVALETRVQELEEGARPRGAGDHA